MAKIYKKNWRKRKCPSLIIATLYCPGKRALQLPPNKHLQPTLAALDFLSEWCMKQEKTEENFGGRMQQIYFDGSVIGCADHWLYWFLTCAASIKQALLASSFFIFIALFCLIDFQRWALAVLGGHCWALSVFFNFFNNNKWFWFSQKLIIYFCTSPI